MKVYEMCLDDSCSYRTEDTIANNAGSILNDELDNQVITKGEQITTGDNSNQKDTEIEENLDAEDKRKQIGDEFYRESEDIEVDNSPKIVKLTGSLIAVTSVGLEDGNIGTTVDNNVLSFPVPVVTTSNLKPQLCTVVHQELVLQRILFK